LTISELKQYRALQNEIRSLKRRINNEHVVTDTVSGSSPEHPYIQGPRTIQGVTKKYQAQLQKAYSRSYDELLKLNEFIDNIPDAQLREIFRYRFVDGKSNQWIALKLGYLSEGTIRNKIKDFFNCETLRI